MLFLITVFICFFSSLILKNTRVIGLFALMVYAFLAGAASPVTTTDYPVYETHYNLLGYEISPFERGYTYLSTLFSSHGYTYSSFRLFFAFLACFILFIGVCLFTKKVAFFAGMYGVTVFFNDATQIRNLMMISLVVLGAGLLTRKRIVWKLIGVGVLIISTQFHDLGFLFTLIFVGLSVLSEEVLYRYYKYIVGILFGLGALFSVGSRISIINIFSIFLNKFSSRTNSAENVVNSFGRGNSWSTIIMVWISLMILSIVLVKLRDLTLLKVEGQQAFKVKVLFIGSSISMLVAFLIVLAPDYSRISRNAFLFFLIMLCVCIENYSFKKIIRSNFYIIFLLIVVLISTTYINTMIWGPNYYNSIPYLMRLIN
ncbi:EpsG family protein [Pediococcus acidilactici]